MITLNYEVDSTGTLLASGPGNVTACAVDPFTAEFLIGTSSTAAPQKVIKHTFPRQENLSMKLEDGEYLWCFYKSGTMVMACTADIPGPGDI